MGLVLQLSMGPIDWDMFAAPVNCIFLALYVLLLVVAYCLRGKVYAVRWMMTGQAAVPAVLIAGLATVVYGLTCDRNTLTAWPFVLLYFWLTTLLGLVCMKRWKSPLFLLNHLGLFLAIVCATLGSADMQKLRMQIGKDAPEWRALDENSRVHPLDMALQLNEFTIEEYPPKLLLIDNETGGLLPQDNPASLVLEDSVMTGELSGHQIRVEKLYAYCVPVMEADTTYYVPCSDSGATTATLISVDGKPATWVSNGSYMYPYLIAQVDDKVSVVMPESDPKRFCSSVKVCDRDGQLLKEAEIEVNKPLKMNGWKIYQLSYDDTKGRWSDISILELVRDPWLPGVYAGIFMLLTGAVVMFITAGGKKR